MGVTPDDAEDLGEGVTFGLTRGAPRTREVRGVHHEGHRWRPRMAFWSWISRTFCLNWDWASCNNWASTFSASAPGGSRSSTSLGRVMAPALSRIATFRSTCSWYTGEDVWAETFIWMSGGSCDSKNRPLGVLYGVGSRRCIRWNIRVATTSSESSVMRARLRILPAPIPARVEACEPARTPSALVPWRISGIPLDSSNMRSISRMVEKAFSGISGFNTSIFAPGRGVLAYPQIGRAHV